MACKDASATAFILTWPAEGCTLLASLGGDRVGGRRWLAEASTSWSPAREVRSVRNVYGASLVPGAPCPWVVPGLGPLFCALRRSVGEGNLRISEREFAIPPAGPGRLPFGISSHALVT